MIIIFHVMETLGGETGLIRLSITVILPWTSFFVIRIRGGLRL